MVATANWNRIIRFVSQDNRVLLGEPKDEDLDIGLAIAEGKPVEVYVLGGEHVWDMHAIRTGEEAVVAKLLSPISRNECGSVRAIGVNYTDHADEMGIPRPTLPVMFYKSNQTIAHPNAPVSVSKVAQREELDYEVELAIVIGRDCKDATLENALEHVVGYTCANDITARKHQAESSQWSFSKSFDNFCPVGPCVVSPRALSNPHKLSLRTTVDGRVLQDGTSATMVFTIADIVVHLSQGSTLPAGTLILTGTPPGVGIGRSPVVWVRDGQEVRCFIGGGIGTLVNKMEYERA